MRIILFLLCFTTIAHAQNHDQIQLANEYLLKGDKKKALELYKELSKQEANHAYIYNNYFNLILNVQRITFGQSLQEFLSLIICADIQ